MYSANYLYSSDKRKIEKKEDVHEEMDNMNEMREKKMNHWNFQYSETFSRWHFRGIFDDRYFEFAYILVVLLHATRGFRTFLFSVSQRKLSTRPRSMTAAAPARRISPILRFRLPFYGLSLLETAPVVALVSVYEREATGREYEIRP